MGEKSHQLAGGKDLYIGNAPRLSAVLSCSKQRRKDAKKLSGQIGARRLIGWIVRVLCVKVL